MKKVKENMVELKELYKKVRNHYMCASIAEDIHHYIVVFPYNKNTIDGVRVSKEKGKINALKIVLKKLENF